MLSEVTIVSHSLASGARLAYKVTCYALERRRMKKEDEVIAQDREKEKLNVEEEGEDAWVFFRNCFRMKERIKHFKHVQHELVKKDSKSNNFTCGSCGEVGQGKRYICEQQECNFEMHLHCATPPIVLSSQMPTMEQGQIRMIHSSAHKEHQVKEIYKNAQFTCTHCKTAGNGERFHCNNCDIDLHQVCAKNPTKITSFMHPNHELELRTKHMLKECSLCQRHGDPNTRMYGCEECGFYLHPSCSQWPQYLVHPQHRLHPLQLKYMPHSNKEPCDSAMKCGKKCKYWRYTCDNCKVHFHLNCILFETKKNTYSNSIREMVDDFADQRGLEIVFGSVKDLLVSGI